MKVGDLVTWTGVWNDHSDEQISIGIITQISRTGERSKSIKVLFTDGSTVWYDSQAPYIKVISSVPEK